MSGELDLSVEQSIFTSFIRVNEIISCGVFNEPAGKNPLEQSAFIELMICVRDLVAKSEKYSRRIEFKDDVNLVSGVEDVSDAIAKVRNAICHVDSDLRRIEDTEINVAFCVCIGKANFMVINEKNISSDYEDDVCFFYGSHKLYLNRHIIRVVDEAKENLRPLLNEMYQNLM